MNFLINKITLKGKFKLSLKVYNIINLNFRNYCPSNIDFTINIV